MQIGAEAYDVLKGLLENALKLSSEGFPGPLCGQNASPQMLLIFFANACNASASLSAPVGLSSCCILPSRLADSFVDGVL